MKGTRNIGETMMYVGVCILTFGIAYIARVVATRAIVMANRIEKGE